MAIALDTTVNGSTALGTSLSWSHTCTGTNLLLFVGVVGTVSDVLTGVTYGSRNLSLVAKFPVPSGGRWLYLYSLIGPPAGADTITATFTSSALIEGFSASYTGCGQVSVPDNSAAPFQAAVSSGADFSAGVSTVEDNCWAIEIVGTSTVGDTITLSAGGTIRQHANGYAIADSNALIHPAGVHSFVQHKTGVADWAAVVASFAPFVAPPAPPVVADNPIGITINDVDWSDAYSTEATPTWMSQLNARGNGTLTLIIRPGELRTLPLAGKNVRIFDDGTPVFSGGIDSISQSWFAQSETYALVMALVSLEQRLDKLLISPRGYIDMTCGAIVANLLATVGGAEGIGAGDIQDGPVVRRTYAWDSLTGALDDLASACGNFYWSVNPDTFLLDFRPRTANPAPFTLLNSHLLWESLSTETSRQDFRTRQMIRCAPGAFAQESTYLAGDGVTTDWTTYRDIASIDSVITLESSGTPPGAAAYFLPSNPSDGDTIIVGAAGAETTYTFKTAIDNTVAFQIAIGATQEITEQHLAAAISAGDYGVSGSDFSLPTWPNPDVWAFWESAAGVHVISRNVRTNAVLHIQASFGADPGQTLAAGVAFNYSDPLKVGVDGSGQADWYFTPGTTHVRSEIALPAGTWVEIFYKALGGDVIRTQSDSAIAAQSAIEGTSALYEQMIDATETTDLVSALALANGALMLYDEMTGTIQFTTRTPGLMVSQLLTLALVDPFDVLNDDWIIHQIDASFNEGERHFRYKILANRAGMIGTWLQFWQQLADNTGGSAASIGGGGGGSGASSSGDGIISLDGVAY